MKRVHRGEERESIKKRSERMYWETLKEKASLAGIPLSLETVLLRTGRL